jgi:beta-lactamase superfamily II metal-dependent hydrolase
MIDFSITYFPVGNGDTTLIQLSDETSILIDCNITQDSEDESKDEVYSVHDHILKKVLKDENDVQYLDVFILTHPDEDHCRGFGNIFYTGDPADYQKKDHKEGKI